MGASLRLRRIAARKNPAHDEHSRLKDIAHRPLAQDPYFAQLCALALLTIHLPYHESDHVLNLAYNALCDGTCLQDIELRRNDEVFLDALGARRLPDPTTAGDFCRRFQAEDVHTLIDIINSVRPRVWARQP